MSLLESGTTTNQLQLLVLKDPLQRIESFEEMKLGHSLNDYYCRHLDSRNIFEVGENRRLTREQLLLPIVKAKGEIYLTMTSEEIWKCRIHIRGQFLQLAFTL